MAILNSCSPNNFYVSYNAYDAFRYLFLSSTIFILGQNSKDWLFF